jgi:hypothetical protein
MLYWNVVTLICNLHSSVIQDYRLIEINTTITKEVDLSNNIMEKGGLIVL